MSRVCAAILTSAICLLVCNTASADQILFSETFDGPALPPTLSYQADPFFTWSVDGSQRLFADRTERERGVAAALSVSGFSLAPGGLIYSADIGTPAGAIPGAYNVGMVFGDYVALIHPGHAVAGQLGALRLEKISSAIDPREPSLIANTDMGYVPAVNRLHRVDAFVAMQDSRLPSTSQSVGLARTPSFTGSQSPFLTVARARSGRIGVAWRRRRQPR